MARRSLHGRAFSDGENGHRDKEDKDDEESDRHKWGRLCDRRRAYIRVVDRRKPEERDFTCRAGVLGEVMRFFRPYLQQGGGRDSVTITVHCDADVFGWLLQAARARAGEERAAEPSLSLGNCVPVLVSSDFLKMDGLPEECLAFLARNLDRAGQLETDLSQLEDRLLARLSDLLDETSLESLATRARRQGGPPSAGTNLKALSAKLFQHKTFNLVSRMSSSLSRCRECGRVFPSRAQDGLLCPEARALLSPSGRIWARHSAQRTFSVDSLVTSLRSRKHAWRDIFWCLWASTVVLPECENCLAESLPLDLFQCSLHPRTPTRGHFPCCGMPAPVLGGPSFNGCTPGRHALNEGYSLSETTRRVLNVARSHARAFALSPAGGGPPSNSAIANGDFFRCAPSFLLKRVEEKSKEEPG